MGSSARRETQARNLHSLFKAVEAASGSMAGSATVTVSPPSGNAGKVFTVPTVTDATSATVATGRVVIDDVNITNGEITSVELINNSGTTTRANLTWTFTGYF